jgi:hypothetical protein
MKTITFIFLLLSGLSLSAQNIDCSGAKTGNFIIKFGDMVTEIVRDEQFQYETIGKVKITTRVEWTSDCTYKLIFVKGNKAYYKEMGKDSPKPDVLVTITAVEGNTYTIEAGAPNAPIIVLQMVKSE